MAEDKELELKDLEESDPQAPAEGAEGEDGGDAPPSGMDTGGLPDIGDLPRSAKDLEAVYDPGKKKLLGH